MPRVVRLKLRASWPVRLLYGSLLPAACMDFLLHSACLEVLSACVCMDLFTAFTDPLRSDAAVGAADAGDWASGCRSNGLVHACWLAPAWGRVAHLPTCCKQSTKRPMPRLLLQATAAAVCLLISHNSIEHRSICLPHAASCPHMQVATMTSRRSPNPLSLLLPIGIVC